jgi:TonB family protein
MWLRMLIALPALLAAGPLLAQTVASSDKQIGGIEQGRDECPASQMAPPVYPFRAARSGREGKAIVSVALDRCGRVLDARIERSTGTAELDQAALDAARRWVFGAGDPETPRTLVNGRYEAPVEFVAPRGSASLPTPFQLGWPKSHKRPRYALETDPPAYESASEAWSAAAKTVRGGRWGPPPYTGMSGSFGAAGTPEAPEFWLFPLPNGTPAVAVRYRPVIEDGEPVVRVLVVCDKAASTCAEDTAFIMKGMPFAKARK